MKLVFLISLPRSGSTWVQRELCRWPTVTSAPETWFLLPYASTAIPRLTLTHYSAFMYAKAREALLARVELSEIESQILGAAGHAFYNRLAQGSPIFLEKTPRYSLILPQLLRAFPDSEFILLWRNPVDVMISLLRSFGGPYDTLFRYKVDFTLGLQNMVAAAQLNQPNIHSLWYEDLLSSTDPLGSLADHLGLPQGSEHLRTDAEIEALIASHTIGDQAYKNKRGGSPYLTSGNRRSMQRTLSDMPSAFWDLQSDRYSKPDLLSRLRALETRLRPFNTILSAGARVLYERNLHGLWSRLNPQRDRSLGAIDLPLE